MGWILVLFGGGALFYYFTRKVVDKETSKNLKFIGKFFFGAIGLIVFLVFLSILFH